MSPAVCADSDVFDVDDRGLLTVKGGRTGLREIQVYRAEDSPHQFKKGDRKWLGKIHAKVQAAGGGSAGADSEKGQLVTRPGGAAGGYGEALIDVSQLGDTETIVVGKGGKGGTGNADGQQGGNSSFGGLVTTEGGAGSTAAMDSGKGPVCYSGMAGPMAGSGGGWNSGGGSSGGALRLMVDLGGEGDKDDAKLQGHSGAGGDSMLGFGGVQRASNGSNASRGYGGGAGGAYSRNGKAVEGAAGGDGIVILYLYA